MDWLVLSYNSTNRMTTYVLYHFYDIAHIAGGGWKNSSYRMKNWRDWFREQPSTYQSNAGTVSLVITSLLLDIYPGCSFTSPVDQLTRTWFINRLVRFCMKTRRESFVELIENKNKNNWLTVYVEKINRSLGCSHSVFYV